jgi:hypothetical protein
MSCLLLDCANAKKHAVVVEQVIVDVDEKDYFVRRCHAVDLLWWRDCASRNRGNPRIALDRYAVYARTHGPAVALPDAPDSHTEIASKILSNSEHFEYNFITAQPAGGEIQESQKCLKSLVSVSRWHSRGERSRGRKVPDLPISMLRLGLLERFEPVLLFVKL